MKRLIRILWKPNPGPTNMLIMLVATILIVTIVMPIIPLLSGWTPSNAARYLEDRGYVVLAAGEYGAIMEVVNNIDDAVQHITSIFPNDTNLTCTLTAAATANTWSSWIEIVDSGATTFSSLVFPTGGHISSIIVETLSEVDTIYMVEISYGDAKTVNSRARFAGGTKFQAPNVQNRMWTDPFPAGETIYYRMKTATGIADIATVHFRYHVH